MLDAPPPSDELAEKAVLGACLVSARALTEVAPLLKGEDFYRPHHEVLWDTITAMHDAGEGVDHITLVARMTSDQTLHHLPGGPAYTLDLSAAVTTATNAVYHARIVRKKAAWRRLIEAGTRTVQLAQAQDGDPGDCATIAQAELAAAHRPDPGAAATLIGDIVDDAIDAIGQTATGISWPWADANRALNPASPGQLILIAARPSVGKSVTIVDVARHAALHRGVTVVLHTLEMSATEVVHRILAAEARVPLDHIQRNTITEAEWTRIARARELLAAAPLHIIDTASVSLADMAASIARHDPGMLCLDYIQLASTNPKVERRQGLEELSRGMKKLAKSAGIPIIAAAQLNRGPEMRVDKKPAMSDLRETGALENDADVVVLLHRPDKDDPECDRAGEIDLIVAKQRNGGTDTITLVHQLHYARFVDYAEAA